jgi:hypothetical protein
VIAIIARRLDLIDETQRGAKALASDEDAVRGQ